MKQATPQERLEWSPSFPPAAPPPEEEAGYLGQGEDQLYYVYHAPCRSPRGRVLLAGPFANERTYSSLVWVRWARLLAGNGFEVLRFDYRGVGESTGAFEQMDLSAWMADLRLGLDFLDSKNGTGPLILLGLRLGALLASQVFAEGRGDGLLMWDPPPSGRQLLEEALRSRLTTDLSLDPKAKRKTRKDYIAELEAGQTVNVDGFHWGRKLWRDAASHSLVLPEADSTRPWQVIHLDRRPAERWLAPGHSTSIPIRPFWRSGSFLRPNLSDLFDWNIRWLLDRNAQEGDSQ